MRKLLLAARWGCLSPPARPRSNRPEPPAASSQAQSSPGRSGRSWAALPARSSRLQSVTFAAGLNDAVIVDGLPGGPLDPGYCYVTTRRGAVLYDRWGRPRVRRC